MTDEKTYPTHRISFAEQKTDAEGRTFLGNPVEVAAVWPRQNGKQGGLLRWHISPQNLKDGAYFVLDTQRQQSRSEENVPTHRISFAEQQMDTVDTEGRGRLGSPVNVATVWPRKNGKEGGLLEWHISPQSLKEGAFFMLDNQREQSRDTQQQDPFEQVDGRDRSRSRSRGR